MELQGQVEQIVTILEQIQNDRSVPRNIRTAVEGVISTLRGKDSIELKLSSSVSVLDEVSNDPNIPMYTRTQVWNIVSLLEKLRE
jgi:uncharacterized protein (UPF0147 family)